MGQPSLDQNYFARVYADAADPWNFATSPYENEKYRATIAALDAREHRFGDAVDEHRFGAAFEIGCSVGVLTAMLAEHCDSVLAVDINERALATARARCSQLSNVRFELMTFPRDAPDERFDLIVISEVAYYWSDDDLRKAVDYAAGALTTAGTLELVHFLPKVDDYVRDGDAVHAAFLDDPRFSHRYGTRAEKYRIDVLSRGR